MRRVARGLSLILLVGGASACATAAQRAHQDTNVITAEQIDALHVHTAYEVVQALHANWLIVRPNTLGVGGAPPPEVVVYMDGTRVGGVSELNNIQVATIAYIEHYDANAATQRWGVGHSQGAILVSTHPR